MTQTEIRAALEARGLRPLRQLGQNFLHDRNLAGWLAEQALAGSLPGDEIVEIGPGLGALTAHLLARSNGRMRGFQLWINLPSKEKMQPARLLGSSLPILGEGNLIRLQPSNSEMKPIYAPAVSVSIQGKVLGMLRKYA